MDITGIQHIDYTVYEDANDEHANDLSGIDQLYPLIFVEEIYHDSNVICFIKDGSFIDEDDNIDEVSDTWDMV